MQKEEIAKLCQYKMEYAGKTILRFVTLLFQHEFWDLKHGPPHIFKMEILLPPCLLTLREKKKEVVELDGFGLMDGDFFGFLCHVKFSFLLQLLQHLASVLEFNRYENLNIGSKKENKSDLIQQDLQPRYNLWGYSSHEERKASYSTVIIDF
ncbi:hypothetical protein STEG23_024804 [Scotinomys teguina]